MDFENSISQKLKLNKKIAIVTDAGSNMGSILVTALITEGALVYGLDNNMNVRNAAQKNEGNKLIPITIEASDHKALSSWAKNTFSDSNFPDIIISNTGVGYFRKTDEPSIEQWQKIKITCLNPGGIDMQFFYDSDKKLHNNILQSNDIAARIIHLLETPDDVLMDEVSPDWQKPQINQTEQTMLSSPVCYANSREVRAEYRDEQPKENKNERKDN